MDAYISLPVVQRKKLSFAKSQAAAVQAWANALPLADLNKSAQTLYIALGEIAELDCKPALKIQLCKSLDSTISHCLLGLQKQYLNLPIVLPEAASQTANLCHAILKRRLSLYYGVFTQLEGKLNRRIGAPKALAIQTGQLMLDQLNQIYLQQALLYRPIEPGFWQFAHYIVQTAEHGKLCQLPNNGNAHNPLIDSYIELLLLGTMNTHQLRQQDLLKIEPLLASWVQYIRLEPVNTGQGFLIQLEKDAPPRINKLQRKPHQEQAACISFDATIIADELKTSAQGLSSNLCKHLILAWSSVADRSFMRLESNDTIDLCIGLNCAHHYIAGQQDFDDIVFGNNVIKRNMAKQRALQIEDTAEASPQSNLFTEPKTKTGEMKVSMESIDFHLPMADKSAQARFKSFNVNIINLSPGGYCLTWDKIAPPSNIRNNELICVKETHHPVWHLACIRWVKQHQEEQVLSINMGVELLSPVPQAVGVRVIDEKGKALSGYYKAILLPENQRTEQIASLVISELTIQPGTILSIEQNGEERSVRLHDYLLSSPSFQQFSFVDVEILADAESSGTLSGLGIENSDVNI